MNPAAQNVAVKFIIREENIMEFKILYVGIRNFIIKVNSHDRDNLKLMKYCDYAFFKNEEGEYELLESRYGKTDILFLGLQDLKGYLSRVYQTDLDSMVVHKNTEYNIDIFVKMKGVN